MFPSSGSKVAIVSQVGTFMHVHGGAAHNGAKITTWSWADQPNLLWHLQPIPGSGGLYHIRSAVDPNFVLHQHGAAPHDGAECTLWDARTNGHQGNLQVRLIPAGGAWWHIAFAHSGKCAHVHGGGSANGTPVTQWGACDQPNLKWRFIAIP